MKKLYNILTVAAFLTAVHVMNATTFTVINTNDSGIGSLRQAITNANADNTPPHIINFAIVNEGPCPHIITPQTNLPAITKQVTINGYSQPGSSVNTGLIDEPCDATICIVIEGPGPSQPPSPVPVTTVTNGLRFGVGSDDSVVRGLCLNNFAVNASGGCAVSIASSRVKVEGCFIGTDATGLQSIPNRTGVLLQATATDCVVGGSTAAARNILAGNYFFFGTVNVSGAVDNFVRGNFIGLDKTGARAFGDSLVGLRMDFGATGNLIGVDPNAPNDQDRNVVAGYTSNNVAVAFSLSSPANTINGNYIGTDITGTKALNGGGVGVFIGFDDNSNNVISNNLISGNLDGIQIGISGFNSIPVVATQITENRIGTNAAGDAVVGNTRFGINLINSDGAQINGNVISGNGKVGLYIAEATVNTVAAGNLIGTDSTGTQVLGNGLHGVQIGSAAAAQLTGDNTIGGFDIASRNIIAGSSGNGVKIVSDANNNVVRNNYIGTSITGDQYMRPNCAEFGNDENGVYILCASNNLVQDNLITQNGENGVAVVGDGVTAVDNAIVSNSIYNNGELGIDLGDDGITPNDNRDPDIGPNRLQNFPIFTVSRCNGSVRVRGNLNSLPNTSFRIQFFSNSVNRPGITEGKTLIGELDVTTDSNGNAPFEQSFSLAQTSGYYVSATATRLELEDREVVRLIETSEFSKGGLCRSALATRLIERDCGFTNGCATP